jgi:hypothetical protein
MADYPPFMNAYGLLTKILVKIKEAKTPDRFTQDFLATVLGFDKGSAKAFIPLAKRIGLINSDGTPSDLYKSFRNPATSKAAIATAIKKGFTQLYEKNEYAHRLPKDKLEGLVIEITGLEKGHQTVRSIIGSFEAMKSFADFESEAPVVVTQPSEEKANSVAAPEQESKADADGHLPLKLGLSYTINLVLPKTDDVAVFNAIFKALRDNLLRK